MSSFVVLAVALAGAPVLAQESAPEPASSPSPAASLAPEAAQTSLLVNTLGPLTAATLTALAAGGDTASEIPFSLWAVDLNLRGHHMFTPRIGLTAQLDYTSLQFLTRVTHMGGRVGPRFSLGGKGLGGEGLSGWALSPYLLGGVTRSRSGSLRLARWGVLGLGAEATRTWVWNHFTLELGLGAYTTANLGYSSQVEALDANEAPGALIPVKPQLLVGVGYAF